MTTDRIFIAGLDLPTHIGVPEGERAVVQTIDADLWLSPARSWQGAGDRIEATLDYAAAAQLAREVAAGRPRQLLETLADDLAAALFEQFDGLAAVEIELRKRILPGTRHVGVRCTRMRPDAG